MPQDESRNLWQRKEELRQQGHARRHAQPDKDAASGAICRKLTEQPEYLAAETVLFYVDARDEVRTQPVLPTALAQGKRVVVPYCVGELIELFHLHDVSELAPGTFRVLEPRPELRLEPQRLVPIKEIDLVVAPGVAFDRQGGRLGHGLGYYDKLLEHLRPEAAIVALAYECQMVPEIPCDRHDVRMDKVITEQNVYVGGGRKS